MYRFVEMSKLSFALALGQQGNGVDPSFLGGTYGEEVLKNRQGDRLTHPSDVQTILNNTPIVGKKLQWIEGTTARFDGYLEFQRRPQRAKLAAFAAYAAHARLVRATYGMNEPYGLRKRRVALISIARCSGV
jgi:hypothetical protein